MMKCDELVHAKNTMSPPCACVFCEGVWGVRYAMIDGWCSVCIAWMSNSYSFALDHGRVRAEKCLNWNALCLETRLLRLHTLFCGDEVSSRGVDIHIHVMSLLMFAWYVTWIRFDSRPRLLTHVDIVEDNIQHSSRETFDINRLRLLYPEEEESPWMLSCEG